MAAEKSKKLFSDHDHGSLAYLDFEQKLLKVGKWAIVSNKILGHFPFIFETFENENSRGNNPGKSGRHLTFRKFSWPVLYSILLMTIFILWSSNFMFRLRTRLLTSKVFGPTESGATIFMILFNTFACVHIQIRSLMYGRRMLKFIHNNCALLKKFHADGYNLEGKWLKKISSDLRWTFFIATILLIAQICYVHLYSAYKFMRVAFPNTNLLHRIIWPLPPDIEERVGSGVFWILRNYLRISNLWSIFFLKMYASMFEQICLDDKTKDFSSNPKIFMSELTILHQRKVEGQLFPRIQQVSDVNQQAWQQGQLRAETNLQLYLQVRKLAEEFNDIFGVEIMWDIGAVSTVTIYIFLACFWVVKGYVNVIADVTLPIIFCSAKIFALGRGSSQVAKKSRMVVPALMGKMSVAHMELGLRRKLQLWKIVGQLNPVRITGKGFFTLNSSLITTIFGGVSAFVVTLVEFRLKEKKV